MSSSEFQLRGVGDPRLALHATSPLPTWLWSIDGTRVLWANPVGIRLFGAPNAAALAAKTFGPADAHRRQVTQLGRRLPAGGAVRLERLRGFGASLGTLMTCACARLDFADGGHGVLVTALDPTGRTMPLVERLHRLVEGAKVPMAAFAPDGLFIGASEAARPLLGFRDLGEAGLEQARSDALAQGRAETPIGIGQMVLQRVGQGADIGLVARIEPAVLQAAPATTTDAAPDTTEDTVREGAAATAPEVTPPAPPAAVPDCALSNEAPFEFALFDAFAERVETPDPAGMIAHAPKPPASEPTAQAVPVQETVQENFQATVQATVEPAIEAAPESPVENPPEAIVSPEAGPIMTGMAEPPSAEPPAPRQHPLRFLWQMDAEGRFVLATSEFIRLMGAHTAAGFGRPWREIADEFSLDPDGRVAQALASQDTWAGITVNWPADGGEHVPVELAGLPIYDRERNFAGFRGFGVCRDLDALNRLDAIRRFELFVEPPAQHALSADVVEPEPEPNSEPKSELEAELEAKLLAEAPLAEAPLAAAPPPPIEPPAPGPEAELPEPVTEANSHPTDPETPVETPPNVVPFRAPGDARSPTLTPVENSAFNELARQLSERLERERETIASATSEPPAAEITSEPLTPEPEAPQAPAEWLTEPAPPVRGHSARDRTLLDLLPSGILIYRLDRLLYANPAFLTRVGYASLGALEDAGGLDALYVEPGVSPASSTSQAGTPVTISATVANGERPLATTEAHLHTIDWDGESAHALICALPQAASAIAAPVFVETVITESLATIADAQEPEAGDADAEDLAAILDTTAEGIVMFDAEGNIHACNRSAEALFGYDGEELLQQTLMTLFAPESQHVVVEYLENLKGQDIASLLDHGREVLGREKKGGVIPLAMIMGRTRPDGPNFFAVFRDLSQSKKGESELKQARRLANGAANAKADMLARISHEIRTPLNAIIGFAEVMISERFGTLGNERYGEYMKDIRASGERVIAIIDDLLELSRIETGKLDLNFANLNLNDLVEACVTVMQPQANRERIIIRTSLGHALPQVTADARAMRQITMNLISNSIRLASAGGQVIVSTALTDRGEIALRIRDTGHGLSEREVAAAMEPFRTPPPGDASDNSALNLSLTKALVEANRAQFNIKSAANSGTLIEVVFAQALAKA